MERLDAGLSLNICLFKFPCSLSCYVCLYILDGRFYDVTFTSLASIISSVCLLDYLGAMSDVYCLQEHIT